MPNAYRRAFQQATVDRFQRVSGYTRILGADTTQNGFITPVCVMLEPNGSGVLNLRSAGVVADEFQVLFYGTGADGATMNARALGWARNDDGLWVPTPLVQLALTLSTFVGLAASTQITALHRFADTVTATLGTVNVDYSITSPANNTPCYANIRTKGYGKIEIQFDRAASATACNGLYKV